MTVKQLCRNELCITSSVTSHLAKYPSEVLSGCSSISLVCMCDCDTVRLSKSASVTDYLRRCPARFSLCSHSIPSVKVQYPPTLCIYQSHNGNLHSGGQTLVFWFSGLRWRRSNTNQRSDLPWSFIKQCPLLGSRVVCSPSFPSGIRREL